LTNLEITKYLVLKPINILPAMHFKGKSNLFSISLGQKNNVLPPLNNISILTTRVKLDIEALFP
jgi:hypothetical protein